MTWPNRSPLNQSFPARQNDIGKSTTSNSSGQKLVRRESSMEAARPRNSKKDAATDTGKAGLSDGLKQRGPAALVVFIVLVIFLGCMIMTILSLPPISSILRENESFIWRPLTAAQFKIDKDLLLRYREAHAWRLFVGMSILYVMLQMFCVPGSGTTLNVLAGCVYHDLVPHGEFLIALPYAVLCTTIGALCCYLLSYSTARELVIRQFPGRISWLRQKFSEQNSSFFFLLSLRVSPLVPAWLLNISAPLMPISVWQFIFATLIGSIPTNAVGVQTGALLSKIQNGDNVLRANLPQVGILLVLAILSAIPAVFRPRHGALPA